MSITKSTKLSTLKKLNIKTVGVVIASIIGLTSVPAQTIMQSVSISIMKLTESSSWKRLDRS